ncbi:MAG TPA: flagellar basal body P-ring formation chaperone FlgA [Balneolales bacterium]|nr:flagellar basal body P-ring formation chaperone FlgA [Balneolales bacterium]
MLFILAISLILNLQPSASAKLTDFLTKEVKQQLVQQYGKDAYRFDVSIRYIPAELQNVSPGQINSIKLTDPNMPTGYALAKVRYDSGNHNSLAQIQLFVDVWQQLLVPKERIMPGQKLSPDMFQMNWVRTTRLQGIYLKDPGMVKGKVSKRLLPAGKPIPPRGIQDTPIIDFGNTVTLEYQQNGLLLSLSCVARQPGVKGDRIKVYCKDTRKTYEVKVINASTVKWEKTL